METPFSITVLMILTVLAGISGQVLGNYFKVPSIVFLLCFGILLGPDGLGMLHPQELGEGLSVIVSLSVALILFEGGLSLQVRELAKISDSLRNLITIGPLIALFGGGILAHLFAGFPWPQSFLYSSLVVVTGPTVISPLLKQVSVDKSVATLLEGEGVLIDPIGAIGAVLVLDVVLNGGGEPAVLITGLVTRLSIGAAIGGSGAWVLGWFLRRADFISADLKNLVVLSWLWSLYGLAQFVRDESGLMAAVVAGVVLSSYSLPELRLLRRFQGQLTILSVSVLFILLAADLSLATLFNLGLGGLLTVFGLMFVVRPLNVWFCTRNSSLSQAQKLFVSWIGPKGIVSASVASLFAILLDNAGLPGGTEIKALVFLTIIMTVFVQGLSAQWVAQYLGVTATQAKGVVIAGSNPLARLIARLFKDREEPVVLIDTSAEAVRAAQEEDLQAFLSSAMNTEVLEAAGLEGMGTFLALTSNGEVNAVLADRVLEEFAPPNVLAAVPSGGDSKSKCPQVQPALIFDLSLKTWNHYLESSEAKLVEISLQEPGFFYQQTYLQALIDMGKLIPLLVDRQDQIRVVQAGQVWQEGDHLVCLLQSPKPKLLKQLSGENPIRLTLEKIPQVTELPLPTEFVMQAAKQAETALKQAEGSSPVTTVAPASVAVAEATSGAATPLPAEVKES